MTNFKRIKEKVKKSMADEPTGHDYAHVIRVLKNAMNISKTERAADQAVVKAAALLHDFAYSKKPIRGEHGTYGAKLVKPLLDAENFTAEQKDKIIESIRVHNTFRFPTKKSFSIETHTLRDADRLDALGYVGIMRGVAYATSAEKDMIKVLEEQLDYKFVTKKGRELAKPRQKVLKEFIGNVKKDLQLRRISRN